MLQQQHQIPWEQQQQQQQQQPSHSDSSPSTSSSAANVPPPATTVLLLPSSPVPKSALMVWEMLVSKEKKITNVSQVAQEAKNWLRLMR